MEDQYRASVRQIAGAPVALVEVQVKRTIFIDAEVWERIASMFRPEGDGDREPVGMSEFAEFWRHARTLPPEAMPYFSMPWSKADEDRIGLMPLAQIAELTDQRSYFRIEGSASSGYVGILNFGGQDRRIDMSLKSMPAFYAMVDATIAEVQANAAAGTITPQEQDMIEKFCREAMKQPGERCEKYMREQIEIQKERDERTRRHEEGQLREREKPEQSGAQKGDFGRDFGGKFKDTA